ncbi:hypothetical protein [Polycladidibacter hongkongensis]|uniref:hypothetical protein n=1 Tax=Polycladidibacter hongkongensis TaxID=1647556 RepID=UPI00082C0CD1|nr:hypothetical protein [Pseudovibrio hongkongensis]
MTRIGLQSYEQAARIGDNTDTLALDGAEVKAQTSKVTVGGQFIKYVHAGEGSAEQKSFEAALKAEFGEDVGSIAFGMGGQKANAASSPLTKMQVIKSIEFARILSREGVPESQNKMQLDSVKQQNREIFKIISSEYDPDIATAVFAYHAEGKLSHVFDRDPDKARSIAIGYAKEESEKRVNFVEEDLQGELARLSESSELKESALRARVEIDWDQFKPADKQRFLERVENNFRRQTLVNAHNPDHRDYLADVDIEKAVIGQLKLVAAIQALFSDDAFIKSAFADAGLTIYSLGETDMEDLKHFVENELHKSLGADGTKGLLINFESKSKSLLRQALATLED